MFSFLTGRAGSGKTFSIRKQIEADPSFGVLASSTGISAINLGEGVTTINSVLMYYDVDSLRDNFVSGLLQKRLRRVRRDYQNIILDECSMTSSEELDIIVEAIKQINDSIDEDSDVQELGLILVGDYGQLSPVEGRLGFLADNWPLFSSNITMLTKIWRQDSIPFVEALEFARLGKGQQLLDRLKALGVEFYSSVDTFYDGTTVFAKNEQTNSYNAFRLLKLPGRRVVSTKEIEGKQLSEWKKIPNVLELKLGAYVMILNNKGIYDITEDPETGREVREIVGFEYVNGDTGYVRGFENEIFHVELKRNKQIVEVPKIVRYNETRHKPDMLEQSLLGDYEPKYDGRRKRWIIGSVEYHPLRLAYASTVHKTQGLTLDNVQLDITNNFFGMDQMCYVALSRARTVEGLRIVAPKEGLVVRRCNADIKVVSFYDKLMKKME